MDWKQTSRDYGPQGRSILLFGLGKTISSPAQLGVREDTSPLLPLEPVPVPATAQHHPTLPRHRGQAAAPCPRDTAGVTSIPCELPLKNQNVTDTCATRYLLSRCPGAAGRPLRCGWERRTNHAEDEQRAAGGTGACTRPGAVPARGAELGRRGCQAARNIPWTDGPGQGHRRGWNRSHPPSSNSERHLTAPGAHTLVPCGLRHCGFSNWKVSSRDREHTGNAARDTGGSFFPARNIQLPSTNIK
nr:uncharacterized protein LOC110366168 isoform X2 [Columba livia]